VQLTDEDDSHHVPAARHRNTATDHAVSCYSPSIELSQFQQCVVHFHLSPSPACSAASVIQRLLAVVQ